MLHKSQKESFHPDNLFSPISYKLLLELFPFCIVLNKDMNIIDVGLKFRETWCGKESIYDKPISNYFRLRRPKGISFTWKNVSFCRLYVYKNVLLKINMNSL